MPEDIGDSIILFDGRALNTHGKDQCSGTPCSVHSPSNHPLSASPRDWRPERALMERICSHGVHHPDPDDRAHWERRLGGDPAAREFLDARTDHPCDGCCTGNYQDPGPTGVQKLQAVVKQYGEAWVNGTREFGPFPHLPDGGELRLVDALEVVLRTMKFAEDRGFDTVSIPLLVETIKYSFSDAKWTDEAIMRRNERP
jgi:hypothetical protein